ncbi:hypothetical protein STRDD11_01667 [Streptococcus sp. DD11]|uniref:hypothetical protein n=1 Tax=Streptococcus sp. DD11 TaxID=1777879 RepID=UPI00079B26D8|nr:hypothetical protein [Streptococcus sp. DD11]KXT83131.1 hypothetical protein STRDD11_01667 [Streptococcus sp. DD11]
MASLQEGDSDWLETAERIPRSLESYANAIGRNFNRHDIGNKAKETAALASVISCRAVGMIDAAKQVSESTGQVFFEDIVICQPTKKEYESLRIYVPQHIAGFYQPAELRRMIGQVFPVKVIDLKQVVFAKRYNSFKKGEEQQLENEYVALGDINIAEYLLNSQVLQELEDGSERSPIHDVQKGMVNYISDNGVFVLTANLERVFIPNKAFSYKYYSRVLQPQDYVAVGELIDFRFVRGRYEQADDKRKRLGIEGASPNIVGERLSLEKNPQEVIQTFIDAGPGTVASGYITDFNAIKGHYFEIDGAYGYPVRLVASERIRPKLFQNRQKISVVLRQGSYEFATDKTGKPYLKVRATVVYNSTYNEQAGLEDFFDR